MSQQQTNMASRGYPVNNSASFSMTQQWPQQQQPNPPQYMPAVMSDFYSMQNHANYMQQSPFFANPNLMNMQMNQGFRMSADMYTQFGQSQEQQWQAAMMQAGNFPMSGQGHMTPFRNMQQNFNQGTVATQRGSPLLQVPQISQSQHNIGGVQGVNHPGALNFQQNQAQMMNPMYGNPMAYSMGQVGHSQTFNPTMHQQQSQIGGAMRPSINPQLANQNASNPNSPAYGQVTSSTDVNRAVQTENNFHPFQQTHFNHPQNPRQLPQQHPSMMTSQEHVMMTSQNMERAGAMTTDTSNMVVRDMGSSLSQLADETQFLLRK